MATSRPWHSTPTVHVKLLTSQHYFFHIFYHLCQPSIFALVCYLFLDSVMSFVVLFLYYIFILSSSCSYCFLRIVVKNITTSSIISGHLLFTSFWLFPHFLICLFFDSYVLRKFYLSLMSSVSFRLFFNFFNQLPCVFAYLFLFSLFYCSLALLLHCVLFLLTFPFFFYDCLFLLFFVILDIFFTFVAFLLFLVSVNYMLSKT